MGQVRKTAALVGDVEGGSKRVAVTSEYLRPTSSVEKW